jgi:hypothetical protein
MRLRAVLLVCVAFAFGASGVTGAQARSHVLTTPAKEGVTLYELCTAEQGCREAPLYPLVEVDFKTKKWGFTNTGLIWRYKKAGISYEFFETGDPGFNCVYSAFETPTGFADEENKGSIECENRPTPEFFWLQRVGGEERSTLKISPASLKPAIASRPYKKTFTVSEGIEPYLVQALGTTPPGLSWNYSREAEGVITLEGIPTTAGTSAFELDAEDAAEHHALQDYTLETELYLPPLHKATAGVPYVRQLVSAGGTEPYEFSVSSGSLPEGLEMTSSGLITGIPTRAGTSTFDLTVLDASHPALSQTSEYTMTVDLGLTPLTLPKGEAGVAYGEGGEGVQLEGQGGVAPYHFNVISAEGVGGFSVNEGRITGTPDEAGKYTVKIEVFDSETPALRTTHKYTINVKAPKASLALGSWELGYSYGPELGEPNYDGVLVEPKGKLHDEDGAPGIWKYANGQITFTLEVAQGDVFEYKGSGPGPSGPFTGLWGSPGRLEKAFIFERR